MTLAIYTYYADAGRNGSLDGMFIAPEGLPEKLVKLGFEISWGDVLGKHSEVVDHLDEHSFEVKSTNQQFIQLMVAELQLNEDRDFDDVYYINGFCPFSRITPEDVADREENAED